MIQKYSIKELTELISIIALVASLIFVGLQLNQDQEIARAGQYQARAETSIANYRSRLESDAYIRALIKLDNGGIEDLNPEELVAYRLSTIADMINSDNAFYQYQHGYMTDEYWAGRRERLKRSLRSDFVRNIYLASALPESFIEYVKLLIVEIESE